MALVGQGDPRWIVTNRDDGTNVNNWHWTETDFTKWAETRTIELLNNLSVDNDKITCTTSDVTCKGEVSVNTRKQKTIFLYELDVGFKWEGELRSKPDKKLKGTVSLPYISEENDDDDFEIRVAADGNSSDHETIRMEFRSLITPILKEKIPQMLQEMRGTATGKTKLPPKNTQTAIKFDSVSVGNRQSSSAPSNNDPIVKAPVSTSSDSPKPRSLDSFTITEKFMCRPVDLFEALIDVNRVRAYAGGDAQVSRDKGGAFFLFGGSVQGQNIEIEYPKRIVQKWRFSTWPEGLFSTVTIVLEEKDGKTICKLTQAGVPSEDKERTEKGWSENFWKRIKGIFGYGSLV
eukprot:TRINITY_DN360_c0_g1_i1.p1 TRINITY_DN360_c0_g1~~TRINITY_DN360_c0_g1_i1.p1  ORF type:complete len:347 (-),score=90.34 TRINITY_DN360_c0_g1_i1:4-1044(-)